VATTNAGTSRERSISGGDSRRITRPGARGTAPVERSDKKDYVNSTRTRIATARLRGITARNDPPANPGSDRDLTLIWPGLRRARVLRVGILWRAEDIARPVDRDDHRRIRRRASVPRGNIPRCIPGDVAQGAAGQSHQCNQHETRHGSPLLPSYPPAAKRHKPAASHIPSTRPTRSASLRAMVENGAQG